MEKKIGDIFEAFQNCRFEDALRQIDQLLKKISKDSKKKSTLTQKDDRMIQIIKCGSLASIGKLHQANKLFESYFSQKVVSQVPPQHVFLLCSIADLSYDSNMMKKFQLLNNSGKSDIRLQRFMLSHRMFSIVSKSFLKQFLVGKKQEDGLAQIFLQYLNEINKKYNIELDYAKDMKIVVKSELNLKMVDLFFMKYLSNIDLSKVENKKLRRSIVDLRIRLSINSGRIQDSKKIYLQNIEFIEDNFVYLRSIRDCTENKESNIRFYIEECGKIFRRNVQIQKYVPLYDFYDQFLDFLLSENLKTDFKSIMSAFESSEIIQQQNLYQFANVENEKVAIHYYKSLYSQFKMITKGKNHEVAKKSDFYKISIKGLMLQLLKFLSKISAIYFQGSQLKTYLSSSSQFNFILEEYFIQFSKTLTFTNQMKYYLPYFKEKFTSLLTSLQIQNQKNYYSMPNHFQRKDDNLILLTNLVKTIVILNKQNFSQLGQVQKWVNICWNLYNKMINQVQQSKRREKGEVFLSDQFILVLSDIIIFYLENHLSEKQQNYQILLETLLVKLMAILDKTTQISPFNAYLKLRLIYVCQKLNYFDKLIDTYLSLDIKSVQFQTLGYLLINPLNNFNLYFRFENNLIKMVRSYQENQRQTSEYALKGLKAGVTGQVFEYFSYQKRLEKSFSKMMFFYTMYLKHQWDLNSQFYLEWIQDKLQQYNRQKQKICFNCDTKTMQNILESFEQQHSEGHENSFNQYYGLFNNVEVFKLEIKLRRTQKTLFDKIKGNLNSNLPQQKMSICLQQIQQQLKHCLQTCNTEVAYNIFGQFNLIDDYLNKNIKNKQINFSKTQLTKRIAIKQLKFHLTLVSLKINLFKCLVFFLHLINNSDKYQNFEQIGNQHLKTINSSIQQVIQYFENEMQWREQVKKCWSLREGLLVVSRLLRQISEQAGRNKKLAKGIKNLITNFSVSVQQLVLKSVTKLKFRENVAVKKDVLEIEIDKEYLQKVFQTDEELRRFVTMEVKEAKNYLIK